LLLCLYHAELALEMLVMFEQNGFFFQANIRFDTALGDLVYWDFDGVHWLKAYF
jgi:hypothetical protein